MGASWHLHDLLLRSMSSANHNVQTAVLDALEQVRLVPLICVLPVLCLCHKCLCVCARQWPFALRLVCLSPVRGGLQGVRQSCCIPCLGLTCPIRLIADSVVARRGPKRLSSVLRRPDAVGPVSLPMRSLCQVHAGPWQHHPRQGLSFSLTSLPPFPLPPTPLSASFLEYHPDQQKQGRVSVKCGAIKCLSAILQLQPAAFRCVVPCVQRPVASIVVDFINNPFVCTYPAYHSDPLLRGNLCELLGSVIKVCIAQYFSRSETGLLSFFYVSDTFCLWCRHR
jgi:hypothetical protein